MKKQKLSMLKAWLLVLCMVVSLVPATVFAEESVLDDVSLDVSEYVPTMEDVYAFADQYGADVVTIVGAYAVAYGLVTEEELAQLEAFVAANADKVPTSVDELAALVAEYGDDAVAVLLGYAVEQGWVTLDQVDAFKAFVAAHADEIPASFEDVYALIEKYGPAAVEAMKDYAVAEGWVTAEELVALEAMVAEVVAAFEADPEAAAEYYATELVTYLYELGLEKGYYTEDEVNAFVADVKAAIANACDVYEDVKDFVETATPQDWENLVKTYGTEALNKLYAYAVAEGYFNPEDPAVQELLADLAALKDLIENTTEEDVVNAVNGYIADLQAKYDAMIFNATHTEFVKGADTNYVALGGSTVTGNFGVSRNDAIYADLVAEELGVVANNLGYDTLTAATALDYVMGNAAAIAAADLVTYQLDAASFVTALDETPDWTKYVDAEVLAQAQAIADEVAAVLALDWSATDVQGMVDAIVADVVDEIAGYDVEAAVLAAIDELTDAVVAELDAFNAVEAAAAVKAAVEAFVAAQPVDATETELAQLVVDAIYAALDSVADADTDAIKAAVDAVVAEKKPVVEQAVVDAVNYVDGVIDACVEKVEAALAMAEGVKQDVMADLAVVMDPAVMGMIEKAAYIAVTYAVDNIAAIEAIQTINPEATVVVVGMYNPLRGLTVTVDGETIDLGEIFEYVIDATNVYYTVYAVLDGGVVFVDVADAETEGLNMNIDVNNFGGFNIQTLVDDMYANAAGHEYIYEQIMDALSVLKGDVDLDGDVDTDDMTVLVRHVANIEVLTEARAMVNGDVDSDGDLDTDDITKLTRFVAGIDESL